MNERSARVFLKSNAMIGKKDAIVGTTEVIAARQSA